MKHNAILTCPLTGVITNPKQHPVPVTPAQLAAEERDACPGLTINLTAGVIGKDISFPVVCLRRVRPEIKDNGQSAWPPMVFDNPVAKIQQFLEVTHVG